MPQGREIAWPVSVETLVALGRIAHPDAASGADRAAVKAALAALSLLPLRDHPATQLSGGEQARALLARALAQETPLLIADKPIAGLDPAAQIGVMRPFLLHQGRIMADGAPETVLTPENLARCFGVTAHVVQGPQGLMLQLLDTLEPLTAPPDPPKM